MLPSFLRRRKKKSSSATSAATEEVPPEAEAAEEAAAEEAEPPQVDLTEKVEEVVEVAQAAVEDVKERVEEARTSMKQNEGLIVAVADDLPAWLAPCADAVKKLAPVLAAVVAVLQVVLPFYVALLKFAFWGLSVLPTNILQALIGLVFCFFGGTYNTLFAAVEALRLSGWDEAVRHLGDLIDEVQVVVAENEKDDVVDEDEDGVADVQQIDSKQLLARKVNLVLTKCHPGKLNSACGGLYTAWLGVLAALKIQFAKTVTLALSIADFARKPADIVVTPVAKAVVPAAYHLWIPVLVGWACKCLGMSIAWYIQALISAVSSATRGGVLCTRSLMAFCVGRGWTLGGLIPKDDKETILDEVLGWALAAVGVYFQVFVVNFTVPWYVDLVLWPFSLANEYIKWAVTAD